MLTAAASPEMKEEGRLDAAQGPPQAPQVRRSQRDILHWSFRRILGLGHDHILLSSPSDFRRKCGIICDRGEFAVGKVLPMVLSAPRDRAVSTLRARDVTGVFVKVKNRREGSLSSARI